MKKPVTLAIAGFILFIVFLIANTPAAQVIPRLPLPNTVSISGVSGTIWAGNASRVIYKGMQVSNVDWKMSVLPLLIGRISLSVDGGSVRDAEQISLKGDISLSPGGITSSDTTLYAPIPLLLSQVQLPLPVLASGRVRINIAELDYQTDGCKTLQGEGYWLNGGVAGLQQQIQLGDFTTQISCDNGPVIVTSIPDNSLNLSGTATIPHKGNVTVSGKFKVSDELPSDVHQAAQMFFADTDAQGFRVIDIK